MSMKSPLVTSRVCWWVDFGILGSAFTLETDESVLPSVKERDRTKVVEISKFHKVCCLVRKNKLGI